MFLRILNHYSDNENYFSKVAEFQCRFIHLKYKLGFPWYEKYSPHYENS